MGRRRGALLLVAVAVLLAVATAHAAGVDLYNGASHFCEIMRHGLPYQKVIWWLLHCAGGAVRWAMGGHHG